MVAGMGIVFLTLALLMGALFVLERLFRPRPAANEAREAKESHAEVAAAIAVVLARVLEDARAKPTLAPSGRAGASLWQAVGRQELMASRGLRRRR